LEDGCVIILPHRRIDYLVKHGTIELWSPRRSVRKCGRCGYSVRPKNEKLNREARCTGCKQYTIGEPLFPEPALNVIQLVKRHRDCDVVTRARAVEFRAAVLQDLMPQEALRAGFRDRDEFVEWFRLKYATGPLVDVPVPCWVVTYRRIDTDIPQFPANNENVTSASRQSVDYEWRVDHKGRERKASLEMVTDERTLNRWAERADEQRKVAHRLRMRGGREAA
jgi:hypothetical protein